MGMHALDAGESWRRQERPASPAAWSLEALAGRFVELRGGPAAAGLSVCTRLIIEAQQAGGLVAWVGTAASAFFPPDLAGAGVDLAAVAVVRLDDERKVWRACDTLLRSGGFALVVVDVPRGIGLPFAAQTRLAGLAHHHRGAMLALTREAPGEGSRSSLVSLRAKTEKRRVGHDCFVCQARIEKDKRRTPGWIHEEWRRGTDGLC